MSMTNPKQTEILYKGTPEQENRRQEFVETGWWVSIPISIVPSHWLSQGEQRFDGGYYAAEVTSALRLIRDSGYNISFLGSLVEPIYYPGRFKRIYSRTRADGTPFLTASDMLHFRPNSEAYLANNSGYVDACRVQPGLILVTRSGSVGRCIIVGERLSKFAITDDALRIQANSILLGYLYAYLSSWIGQALISKDQYGSAIKHLEPHHLAGIPVPLLPENDQRSIHNKIIKAFALREEANDLLDTANELLHKHLNLPRFDYSLVPYLPEPTSEIPNIDHQRIPHPRAFSTNIASLNDRFDASYHIPIVRTIQSILLNGRYNPIPLGELVQNVHLPARFKRIYVKQGFGLPFVRPSHLPQIRPFDLGYLSHLTPTLESLKLHRGEVLVVTDGTVGGVCIVSSRRDGWAGSNNIARITYGIDDHRNGYLAAFLSSPYGYHQLTREIYGGVIDHIEAFQVKSVNVPNAPSDVQKAIGELVVNAYEKKDEASEIEEMAINDLEGLLQK